MSKSRASTKRPYEGGGGLNAHDQWCSPRGQALASRPNFEALALASMALASRLGLGLGLEAYLIDMTTDIQILS